MENMVAERLRILVDEVGGEKEFIRKFDESELISDIIISENTLKKWLDGNTEPALYNAYLIANVFRVSMNWLLGLTGKMNKNIVFYKRPSTYGDVLIFFSQICEIGTAAIYDAEHYIINLDIYASDGLTLPQYIVINDKKLYEPIEKLIRARSLNENDFIDSLEEMFESQMELPLQYCDNNGHYREKQIQTSGCTGDNTAKKILSPDGLKEKIADWLEKLTNDMSQRKLATEIRCPKSTLCDWISKKSIPKISDICLLANKFEKSADWILGMDENENRDKFYKGEWYTYGGVLYILGHLIANGTIGFIGELSPFASDDDENAPKMNDIFSINDGFLFCLLLRMESLKRNSNFAPKGKLEQLFETYKNFPLLSYNIENKNLKPDIDKILCNLKGNKRYRDIDLDRLYETYKRWNDLS